MQFHHRAVPIVLTSVLIDSIGFGIVLPSLPDLIVSLTHMSLAGATETGVWMLTAYAVAQFLAGPVVGGLGDTIGRRPVILFSMIAFAIDYALMGVAPTIAWLFLGRVVAGLAGAVYGPANAVLADVTPPENRGQVFSLMGAAFGGGFILGPALGGVVAEYLGVRAPFLAAAALAAINAVWIIFFLPETMTVDKRRPFVWKQAHVIGAFRPLFRAGNVKWLLLVALCWQFAHMVYPATWAFWAKIALHWDKAQIGYSLALSGLSMMVVQALLTGKAIKKFGEEKAVVIGMVVALLCLTGYVFARQGWIIYLIILPSALQGFVFPSINALLSRATDASHQGALQGGMQSLGAVAAIFSPLVLGYALAIGERNGFPSGNFVVAAALVLVALLIVLGKVVGKVALKAA